MAAMRIEMWYFKLTLPLIAALGVVLYFSLQWFLFLSLCLIVWLQFRLFHHLRKIMRVSFLDLGTKLTGIMRKLNITVEEVNAIGDEYINSLPPDQRIELMAEIKEVYGE